MISDELYKAAKLEAAQLRKFATQKEIEKLEIELLNPKSATGCVYGLMTGSCWSQRSLSLMKKCAVPHALQPSVNKKPIQKCFSEFNDPEDRVANAYTAIEVFIQRATQEQNEDLLDFIKGKTNNFKL